MCVCGVLSVHVWVWIWSSVRPQRALRTWLPQSTLLMHLMVMTDRRNGGAERVEGRRRETEEQWEGVWPELRFTFHCENTLLERSSERSDRYSEVCQHRGKCTLVRPLRITHIKHSSFTNGHTKAHTGDCRILNMPPCFSSSWNNSRPVHLGSSLLSLLTLSDRVYGLALADQDRIKGFNMR